MCDYFLVKSDYIKYTFSSFQTRGEAQTFYSHRLKQEYLYSLLLQAMASTVS